MVFVRCISRRVEPRSWLRPTCFTPLFAINEAAAAAATAVYINAITFRAPRKCCRFLAPIALPTHSPAPTSRTRRRGC